MEHELTKEIIDAKEFAGKGAVSAHNMKGKPRISADVANFLDSTIQGVRKEHAAELAYNLADGGKEGEKAASMITDADTVGSVFFPRQLEFIQAQVYRVDYEEITYRKTFPILNLENAGYTSHTYRVLDRVGKAKPIGSYSNDMERVDVSGKEVTAPVIATGVAYGANMQELASAQLTNFSLLEERANAARRAVEELNQEYSLNGNAKYGLVGLFTDTNVSKANVPNGGTGLPEWDTKTADEIYKDITDLVSFQKVASKNTVVADTLIMPLAQYTLIETRQKAAGTDTTILNYALNNIASLTTIMPVTQMEGAGTAGADAMVLYKKDPLVGQFVIGLEHTFLDPQLRGVEIIVPSWATTGALTIRKPLGYVIREKI